MKTACIALFLIASATAVDASAEPSSFRLMIRTDSHARTVTVHGERVLIGSSDDANLYFSDLPPQAAVIQVHDCQAYVRPMDVEVVPELGDAQGGCSLLQFGEEVHIDRYTFTVADPECTPIEPYDPDFLDSACSVDPEGLAVVSGHPPTAGHHGRRARKPEFEASAYRFCHDERFGVDGTFGTEFCAVFDESTDHACPEARKSCPNWNEELTAGSTRSIELGDGKGGGRGGRGARRRQRPNPSPIKFPKELGILLLVLLGGALAFWVIRTIAAREDHAPFELEGLDDVDVSDLDQLPDGEPARLLQEARRRLSDGRTLDAATVAHLGLLRLFDDRGWAPFRRSKTNGEYLRQLRNRTEWQAIFRSVSRQTERLRFGDGKVDAQALGRSIDEALNRIPRGSGPGWTGAVGATVVLLTLLIPQPGCNLNPRPSFSSRGFGPVGLAAFPRMIQSSGYEMHVHRGSKPPESLDGIALIVVEAKASRSADIWEKFLESGGTVFEIDERSAELKVLGVSAVVTGTPAVDRIELNKEATSCASWFTNEQVIFSARLPPGRRFVPLTNDADRRLLIDDAGFAVAVAKTVGTGCHITFSTWDLFTNASLTLSQNSALVHGMTSAYVSRGPGVLLFDWAGPSVPGVKSSGGSGSSPAKAFKTSNLLPFILQALLLGILFLLFIGAAFGRLRDPQTKPRRAFIEHVDALGARYAAVPGGSRYATRTLARLFVTRTHERVRGRGAGAWQAISRDLAKRHGLPEADVREVLELGAAGAHDAPFNEARATRTLRILLGRDTDTRKGR